MKITSACRGRSCDSTSSEAAARPRGCARPPRPEPFPAPGQAGYITCQASLRARRAVPAARTVPAAGGPSSPASARGRNRARGASHRLRPAQAGAPGFQFRPWRSHNPRNQHTDTITKAATRRQHRGGTTRGPRRGWQSAHLAGRGHGRPSRPVPPGGERPAGSGGCFEVLLTLVRQLVELRHLERAAPLFQRLPAAVHCGAETVFAREVRMQSSLPAAPRRAAPAAAGGGGPAEGGRAPPAPAGGGGAAGPSGASPLRPRAGPREAAGRPRREARLAPPGPGRGAGARGGGPRELPSPAGPHSRPAPPAPSGARSRLAVSVSRCGCGNCRLFGVGKGGKVGGRPGSPEAGQGGGTCGPRAGRAAPGAGWRYPRGLYSRSVFTVPETHVSPASPSPPFSGKAGGGSGEEGSGRSPTAGPSLTPGSGRGHPPP